jgi:hypothetical protein
VQNLVFTPTRGGLAGTDTAFWTRSNPPTANAQDSLGQSIQCRNLKEVTIEASVRGIADLIYS